MFQECSQKRRRQRGLVKDKTLCRLICSSKVNAFMAGAFPFPSFSKARDFQERLNFKFILAFLTGRNLLVSTAKRLSDSGLTLTYLLFL